jgi:hypothetical protein
LADDRDTVTDFEAAIATLRGSLETMKRLAIEARQPPGTIRRSPEPATGSSWDQGRDSEADGRVWGHPRQQFHPRLAATDGARKCGR